MLTIVCVTPEPHGTYHLLPLMNLGYQLIHLQPAPAHIPAQPGMITITDDPAVIGQADMFIVTGGLTTPFTEAMAHVAHAANVPVVFLELAYPASLRGRVSKMQARAVLSTTMGGAAVYADYFPGVPIQQVQHPTLVDLPVWQPSATPRILLGSGVSTEQADGGNTMRAYAAALTGRADIALTIRLHPREPANLWKDFDVLTGGNLAMDLRDVWAFITYQTTALLTSEAMGVPSFYLADEPWMTRLLPSGYTLALPVTLGSLTHLPPIPDTAANIRIPNLRGDLAVALTAIS